MARDCRELIEQVRIFSGPREEFRLKRVSKIALWILCDVAREMGEGLADVPAGPGRETSTLTPESSESVETEAAVASETCVLRASTYVTPWADAEPGGLGTAARTRKPVAISAFTRRAGSTCNTDRDRRTGETLNRIRVHDRSREIESTVVLVGPVELDGRTGCHRLGMDLHAVLKHQNGGDEIGVDLVCGGRKLLNLTWSRDLRELLAEAGRLVEHERDDQQSNSARRRCGDPPKMVENEAPGAIRRFAQQVPEPRNHFQWCRQPAVVNESE